MHVKKQQQGFVLILALVMLSVLTIIGVSSMSRSNMELRAAANVKQHLDAYNAVQSMLEYAVSKDAEVVIDFQTTDTTPQPPVDYPDVSVNASATAAYIGCGPGFGSSLEEGKGFGYGFFIIQGDGTNVTTTSSSSQRQGVRYPSAAC